MSGWPGGSCDRLVNEISLDHLSLALPLLSLVQSSTCLSKNSGSKDSIYLITLSKLMVNGIRRRNKNCS